MTQQTSGIFSYAHSGLVAQLEQLEKLIERDLAIIAMEPALTDRMQAPLKRAVQQLNIRLLLAVHAPDAHLASWLAQQETSAEPEDRVMVFRRLTLSGLQQVHQQLLENNRSLSSLSQIQRITQQPAVLRALQPLQRSLQHQRYRLEQQHIAWQTWREAVEQTLVEIQQLAGKRLPGVPMAQPAVDLVSMLGELRRQRELSAPDMAGWRRVLDESI